MAHLGDQLGSARSRSRRLRVAFCAAVACAAVSPAAIAVAGGEAEPEGAAEAVYTAVTATYPAATKDAGRPAETFCAGGRPPFRCQWWVIKNRFDRVSTIASESIPMMSRRGEGNAHRKASRVKFAGSAVASWTCTKRTKRNVCTAGGYVVELKRGA